MNIQPLFFFHTTILSMQRAPISVREWAESGQKVGRKWTDSDGSLGYVASDRVGGGLPHISVRD